MKKILFILIIISLSTYPIFTEDQENSGDKQDVEKNEDVKMKTLKDFSFMVGSDFVGYFFNRYNALVHLRLSDSFWLGSEYRFSIHENKDNGITNKLNSFRAYFLFEPWLFGELMFSIGLLNSIAYDEYGSSKFYYYCIELAPGYKLITPSGYTTFLTVGLGYRKIYDQLLGIYIKEGRYYTINHSERHEYYLAVTGAFGWAF